MAGDWIKMRTDLYRDPKVCVMAESLIDPEGCLANYVSQNLQCDMAITRNALRCAVVGALVTTWGVMRYRGKRNDNDDLIVFGVTHSVIDDIADLQGFGAAMMEVGWLIEDSGNLIFPRFFEEFNTEPGKNKSNSNAERQRRYREKLKLERNALRDGNVTPSRNDREEKRREDINTPQTPPNAPTNAPPSAGFDVFWKAYPRKVDKEKAIKAWKKIKPDGELAAKMLEAIGRQKKSDDWTKDGGKFIPYPTSWLNGKRWEDEANEPAPSTNGTHAAYTPEEIARKLEAQTRRRLEDESRGSSPPPKRPAATATPNDPQNPGGAESP